MYRSATKKNERSGIWYLIMFVKRWRVINMSMVNKLKFKQAMKAICKDVRQETLQNLEEKIIVILKDDGSIPRDQKKDILLQLFEAHLDERDKLNKEIANIKTAILNGDQLKGFVIKRGLTIERKKD